ncbi:MAG TPA: dephospho-CoA kinase [Eubacteriaceae bacterium]|nr:dephospho-CoA kinase [Eubacteriaceae bacterium]
MKVIGVTGGIASGKSSVCRLLARRPKTMLIDADQLARDVVKPGTVGLKNICRTFGSEMMKKDGSLDRQLLGEQIFKDAQARERLNQIVHPLVEQAFLSEKKKAQEKGIEYLIYDCPLLIDIGYHEKVDVVILVVADEHERVERLKSRNGLSEKQAKDRMKSQLSDAFKKSRADMVVYNDGSERDLTESLDCIWQGITSF